MRKAALAIIVTTIAATALVLAGGTRSLTDIKGPIFAAGALAAAFLVSCAESPRRVLCAASGRLLFPLAALTWLAFTALSPIWAAHPWICPYTLAGRFIMLLAAFAAVCAASYAGGRRVLAWAWAVVGAAVSIFSLVWHGLYAHNLNDVRAPMGNANLLGAFLILPITFGAALILREWRGRRRGGVIAALGLCVALSVALFLLCRSLSAWMGLAVAAAVFAVLSVRRRALAALVAAIVAIGAFSAFFLSGAFGRLESSRTYILRMEYWRRAAVMARRRPLLGWGAGNYFTDNQSFGAETNANVVTFDDGSGPREVPLHRVLGNHHPSSAHNAYLDEAAEGGIAGLALFALVVAAPLIRALSARRAGVDDPALLDGAAAAYAAFLAVIAVTMNMRFADFAPHFWILAGFLLSAGPREKAPRPTAGAARIGAAALILAAAGAWGIWEFAVSDYRSSMEYKSGLSAVQAGRTDEGAALLAAAGKHTWDPLLAVWSLDLRARAYLAQGEERLQSAWYILDRLGEMVAGYHHYLLGRAYELSGDYARALESYREHARFRPAERGLQRAGMFAEVMLALGSGGENAFEPGIEYFRRFPAERARMHLFFQALLDAGEAALPALAQLAEGFDAESNPDERYLLGRLGFAQGDYSRAVELMESAFAEGCRMRGINRYRALAYIKLGRFDKARETVARGRKLNPTCKNLIELEKWLENLDESAGAENPLP